MALCKTLLLAAMLLLPLGGHAEQIRVAAAADLKFALDEIAATFKQANPTDELDYSGPRKPDSNLS
ncbi:MAG: hypothetical protein KA204_00635 [Chromatiaceae bacterium]|nr:hypothetical protein [Chromatiaceae bacterium]MBP6733674.1 hypothetical protein [Chromatiaceae bacterium]MBP6806729.1 hypothetical protein [Chromatiaceae bacterium]MBP8289260.1 hypothetical protein [Chromatiaceae bacterium]MBP9603173.1 hypothetical protein [Chromatiaceae bacterium]